MTDDNSKLIVPEPEYDDPKELYAFSDSLVTPRSFSSRVC
jgi:hypothetical protein